MPPEIPPNITAMDLKERIEADALERHRMMSNAFYQQDKARHNTAPASVKQAAHHEVNQLGAHRASASSTARDSQHTTVSQFINTDSETARTSSPERTERLKLFPDNQEHAIPTARGIIEDRAELQAYNASGQKIDRTPVYIQSAKPDNKVASGAAAVDTSKELPKSPKKRLLDRFHFPRSKFSNKDATQQSSRVDVMVPKAAAFFGTSMSSAKKAAGVSNTDSKSSFSANTNVTHGPNDPADLVNRKDVQTHATPVTPFNSASKPERIGEGIRRVVSQPKEITDLGQNAEAVDASTIVRSKSLHYYDKQAPPTPPIKDTPPDVKLARRSTGAVGPPVNDTPPAVKHARTSLGADEPFVFPKTPRHRRTTTIEIKTPSPLRAGPRYAESWRWGMAGHRGHPTIVTPSQTAALVDSDRVITKEEDVEKAEEDSNVSRGQLADGRLPPTIYDPYSPPTFKFRHVDSPSVYQEAFEDRAPDFEGSKRGERQPEGSPLNKKNTTSGKNRNSRKSVTFNPRHTSHHYEVQSAVRPDKNAPPDSPAPRSRNRDKKLSAGKGHKKATSSTASLERIRTMMNDRDTNASFARLGDLFNMRAEMTPEFGSLEPYGTRSAVPSPLHVQGEGHGTNPFTAGNHQTEVNQTEARQNEGQQTETPQTQARQGGEVPEEHNDDDRMRVDDGYANGSQTSTLATDGRSTASDLSLRERFFGESQKEIIEAKLDQMLLLFKVVVDSEMQRNSDVKNIKKILYHMATKLDKVEDGHKRSAQDLGHIEHKVEDVQNKLQELERKLNGSEYKLVNMDKHVEDVQYNVLKFGKITEKTSDALSNINNEVAFLEDNLQMTGRKIDAIEFQVSKLDHVSLDHAALVASCEALGAKVNMLSTMIGNVSVGDNSGALGARMADVESGVRNQAALLDHIGGYLENQSMRGSRAGASGSGQNTGEGVNVAGQAGNAGLWQARADDDMAGLALWQGTCTDGTSVSPASSSSSDEMSSGMSRLYMGPRTPVRGSRNRRL